MADIPSDHPAVTIPQQAVGNTALLLAPGAKVKSRVKGNKASKKRIKKLTLHQITTQDVFMHVYFKNLDPNTNYTDERYFKDVLGPNDEITNLNQFEQQGIQINLVRNPNSFTNDFEKSLNTPGAIVVYFGHTVLDGNNENKTLGLTPIISKKPRITSNKLIRLLNKSKAKVVILAGCASDGCVRKVKGDTVVIVTESGNDRVTSTTQWAPSIRAFLDNFIGNYSTVGESFEAANKVFKTTSTTDSFKLINGDLSLKIF